MEIKKSRTFIASQMKLDFACGGLFFNIPNKRTDTRGCCPTPNPSMGLWYADIICENLQ